MKVRDKPQAQAALQGKDLKIPIKQDLFGLQWRYEPFEEEMYLFTLAGFEFRKSSP
jgi:hypothetical protein